MRNIQEKDGQKNQSNGGSAAESAGTAATSSQKSKGKARATNIPDDSDEDADDEGVPARDNDDGNAPAEGDDNSESDDEREIARPSFSNNKSVEDTMQEWLALQPGKRHYTPKDVAKNLNVSNYCIFDSVLIQYHRDFAVL